MAENLPLIPSKSSVCADVKPVLREVFRELDYLPPLATELAEAERSGAVRPRPERSAVSDNDSFDALPAVTPWVENYTSECNELWVRERELKQQHANRISCGPLPNVFRLHTAGAPPPPSSQRALIDRTDLMPTIQQNAGRDASLWIRNILNRSFSNVIGDGERGSRVYPAVKLEDPEEFTIQTLSIGEVIRRLPPPAPQAPPTPALPEHIVCIPPHLDFINFAIGQTQTQCVRLVNVSKFEVRLSVRPPRRRELDVQLCGARGLTVTSGAAAELRVHFRPRDVRALHDALVVRASLGRGLVVPIACYMQPPILDILVPNVMSSALWCTPDELRETEGARGSDVLELGSRLLGDVHCARLLLTCDAEHASFFLLTEDAWLSYCLDCVTCEGSVVAGPFALWPAWWAGGGAVRALAWCRAARAGLHAASLRLLASTAVARPLHVLADSLHWRPDHLTIEAQAKDYDICSEDDEACEYYVSLGTTFPHRALAATVQLLNHSPIVYSYYWSIRPWGVCSCWEEEGEARGASNSPEEADERLCIGARAAKATGGLPREHARENARLVRVEAARGQIGARSSCALHVRVPDAGVHLGTQRAVLMLVLKDIPKESFSPDCDPMIISTEQVEAEVIPGVQTFSREVCDVVAAQMEVWWEVAPVRFVLDPPTMLISHSRRPPQQNLESDQVHYEFDWHRLKSLEMRLSGIQLYGCDGIPVTWEVPEHVLTPPPLRLAPAQTCFAEVTIGLPSLPDERPAVDILKLLAMNEEWRSQCELVRECATRHPALRPARCWLGVVPPGTHMHTSLEVFNDTQQRICWWAEAYRWWGERLWRADCARALPCPRCQERACACALLRPARGALDTDQAHYIHYDVNAPDSDGCVATLVQMVRTLADTALAPPGAGSAGRASLVAYRVLAPRLVLRALPCLGDKDHHCEGCLLDPGLRASRLGSACLRPRGALALARRACYRLRVTNLTPLSTTVHWAPSLDGDDVLKVTFMPNSFLVNGYGEHEIRVVVEARRVCARRVFVHRARVACAYRPLYLVIDAAVAGLELTCTVPLGDGEQTDSSITVRRTQREEYPWEKSRRQPSAAEQVFAEEDRKRLVVKENICKCPFEMIHIPSVKQPLRPGELPPIEIVSRPPSLRRVCSCSKSVRPVLPELTELPCLQFTAVPLRTVQSRTLVLRNESVLTAHWSATLRRWPRHHTRTLSADQWAGDVRAPGLVAQCAPARGVLAARATERLHVHLYADCWGLYYEQLMIQVDSLEPIIVDIWVEVVGPPLQFAVKPDADSIEPPTLWLSAVDPERALRVTNVSRSELTVHAYVLQEHDRPQQTLPFRLYLRFYDVPPRSCPCLDAFTSDELDGEEASHAETSSYSVEMDTAIEVYLAPDYGLQQDTDFQVTPEATTIGAGDCLQWRVALAHSAARASAPTAATLLLRMQPTQPTGWCWARPSPPEQRVLLRRAPRAPLLQASRSEVRVALCALALPHGDVMRVRKRFHVLNVGNGGLELTAATRAPWSVVLPAPAAAGACGTGCACAGDAPHQPHNVAAALHLRANSSTEVCVEVCVRTAEAWPVVGEGAGAGQAPHYDQCRHMHTPLHFYDDDNVLLTMPLLIEIEYPIIYVEPSSINFGFVTDGDTRKTFFTVTHSSSTLNLDLVAQWDGDEEFQLWPPCFRLAAGERRRVYLQYTAQWRGAPAEGWCRVAASGAAGTWCRAALPCRAAPARDHKCRAAPHDHTDDAHLLPPHHAHHASPRTSYY